MCRGYELVSLLLDRSSEDVEEGGYAFRPGLLEHPVRGRGVVERLRDLTPWAYRIAPQMAAVLRGMLVEVFDSLRRAPVVSDKDGGWGDARHQTFNNLRNVGEDHLSVLFIHSSRGTPSRAPSLINSWWIAAGMRIHPASGPLRARASGSPGTRISSAHGARGEDLISRTVRVRLS